MAGAPSTILDPPPHSMPIQFVHSWLLSLQVQFVQPLYSCMWPSLGAWLTYEEKLFFKKWTFLFLVASSWLLANGGNSHSPPLSMQGFHLDWAWMKLVNVVITEVIPHVQLPCCVWRTLFSHPFQKDFCVLEGGSTVNMPYMEMSILQAFILYTLTSCWSLW